MTDFTFTDAELRMVRDNFDAYYLIPYEARTPLTIIQSSADLIMIHVQRYKDGMVERLEIDKIRKFSGR